MPGLPLLVAHDVACHLVAMRYGGCVIWQLGTIDIRYVGEAFRQIEEVARHNSRSGT